MQKHFKLLLAAGLMSAGMAAPTFASGDGKISAGQEIAFDRQKGNCLACHAMPGTKAEMPGNIAPPLVTMKLRYPDKAKLRAQIWDAMQANPNTSMPPFGKHQILTEEEIDLVTEFIHSL
ncbi:MAG: sulfur oxidation c-type cytochrome SoxX [Pseudomonadota bacterium]